MRNIAVTAIALFAAIPMAGCLETAANAPAPPPGDLRPPGEAEYLGKTAVQETGQSRTESAVENALIWSEKYSQAVEKLVRLQQENSQLTQTADRQGKELSQLQSQLDQAQSELKEANALLIEMRQELQKWKDNILGFRQEMRHADRAQLDALAKVLRLLGGELPESMSAGAATKPVNAKGPTSVPSK